MNRTRKKADDIKIKRKYFKKGFDRLTNSCSFIYICD